MRKLLLSSLLICGLALPLAARADEPLDDVSAKAAQLESSLGKLRDTTPEAADLMVQLANLYQADGRVFGLIRVTETFVTKHSGGAEHREMMLKLIDGLLAMSRNKELVATCRQYLGRYSNDPQCARLEKIVATALEQLGDRQHAAEMCVGIWQRQKDTPDGRGHGVKAIWLYSSLNSPEGFSKAGEQAEAMLDTLPAGELANEVGYQGVQNWRRVGNWAKSNVIGNKILAKNVPMTPGELRDLHYYMAESFAAQNQLANAVDSMPQSPGAGRSGRPGCPDAQLDARGQCDARRNRAGSQRVSAEVSESARPLPDAQLRGPRIPAGDE